MNKISYHFIQSQFTLADARLSIICITMNCRTAYFLWLVSWFFAIYTEKKKKKKKILFHNKKRFQKTFFVKIEQWKHQEKVRNLFKVDNKYTRTTSITSFCCLYCQMWTDFKHFYGVSIAEIEQVNAGWESEKNFIIVLPERYSL